MSKRAAPPPNASDAAGPEGQRFRDDLIRALGHAPRGGILLAVSGGPDSMAMLTLAQAGGVKGVHVATVDHRLRAEAAAEAAGAGAAGAAAEAAGAAAEPLLHHRSCR